MTSYRARLMRKAMGRALPDESTPIDVRRAAMDRLDKLPRPRKVDYADTSVGGVPAIVATPTAVEAERHILYIHGGAYILGSPKSHIALAARLAKLAEAVVTVIDYRLAPEHPYPAAIDDCVAAYRDIAGRVDPSRITIAGDSAGGGATLATLCALRDAGDPLPACAYVLSPWTDLTGSGESVQTLADLDPMIKPQLLGSSAEMYAADTPLDDPGVSPLFADLAGLPPMLIQTGTDEVLLADSTRLAERAAAAGVHVQLDLAEEMWHVYPMFAGVMPEAKEALAYAARFIRAHSPRP
ncbi:alpha/beta hydrolase [Ilumatobacter nonamiensis]|uniref:alpha/beta hydrolase n=1 Tax=Ilumatobacter nonamiensis TaxID=467093 RepID=UPI0003497D2B|nr:alpha/beta hydrolase [Ilumatobacter nonamiensis]